jgi:1,2-dihydroxy-3-keto-5-methylthiopentene dioxygenase
MVSAWLYNETTEDGRQPHKFTPNQPVSLNELKDLGVLHWTFDPETQLNEIDKLAEKFEYKSRDKVFDFN